MSRGDIRFEGRSIAALPTHQIAQAGIGWVPDDRRLCPTLTVAKNLSLGVKRSKFRPWTLAEVTEIFTPLKYLMAREAETLSGGEMQMVAIARALLGSPGLALFDEPEGVFDRVVPPAVREAIRRGIHDAEDERAMLFEQVRMQRDSDILRWTERSIGLLAEAESVVAVYDPASTSADARAQLRSLRTHLSAVVDSGRMFFPNSRPDSKGQEKPGAYQGERQWILEVLVGAHAVLAKVDSAADVDRQATVARLAEIRREFVSQAQLAIDPRRYMALREMNEIRLAHGLAPQSTGKTE